MVVVAKSIVVVDPVAAATEVVGAPAVGAAAAVVTDVDSGAGQDTYRT